MDPQSQAFSPYGSNTDTWRLQAEVARVQQIQAEHAERIARLERRQDEDARIRSVWGNQSPFPSVLSGTPQHGPVRHPSSDHLRTFDDEASNLMGSLHLDAEDEPRRGMGATSRANSVRFDESANQNHFAHSSRPSVDLASRTSSGLGGLGGLQMTERSSSHKSDGRASSAHSVRSTASGRANSVNLDMGYGGSGGGGDVSRSPLDTPALAPGLFLLGFVPAIIRCWMNTNFKHDALLYAAVCTGSYKSYLDLQLIRKLGFEDAIRAADDGTSERTVELPVYFPEAVPHPASSRSSSPAPQLPTLTATFHVIERAADDSVDSHARIQIFLGSDTLRAHNADVLFSSNSMTLFDDDHSKLSIPLVRPENEAAFKSLYVSSSDPRAATAGPASAPTGPGTSQRLQQSPYLNGLGQGSSTAATSSAPSSPPFSGKYGPAGAIAADASTSDPEKAGAAGSDSDARPASRLSNASRPSLTMLNTRGDTADHAAAEPGAQTTTPLRSGGSPAVWGSWRRDGGSTSASGPDWASAGKGRDPSYQRRDAGIKVLKPKSASRSFSAAATTAAAPGAASMASPADGRSRFFEEGRRREGPDSAGPKSAPDRADSPASSPATAAAAPSKAKANPIGGGSAFSWLNAGGGGGSGSAGGGK